MNYLREYWLEYATFNDPDKSIVQRFRDQSETIMEKEPKAYGPRTVQALGRSFGPRFGDSSRLVADSVNDFWDHGGMGNTSWTSDQDVNPLALYSSMGGDQFIIDYRTNPLAGFHLAPAVTVVDPKPPYVNHANKDKAVVLTAMLQFKAWCTAFQQVASQSRVQIRYFIGDALNFCRSLNQLQSNHSSDLNVYSAPWSTYSLQLDGEDYRSDLENRAPVLFHVIETSNLADDVGLINILTAAVPLLERAPSSVLYTDTLKSIPPKKEAPNLLTDLLCGDIATMCSLFGVIPTPYVTGVTMRARDDTFINKTQPIFNRIQWKVTTTIDSNVEPLETKLSFDPEPLADLLYSLYLKMFAYELIIKRVGHYNHESYQPQYSRGSYAAFLAFLKPRVNVEWEKCLDTFTQKLEKYPDFKDHFADTLLQFYLFGVYRASAYRRDLTSTVFNSNLSDQVAMLTRQKSPCLVVTIPRSKLTVFSKKSIEKECHSHMIFEVDIVAGDMINTFASLQPIFGTLNSIEANACEIVRDASGWFGSSDLHVCLYVPSYLFQGKDLRDLRVVVRCRKETRVDRVYKNTSLGANLEVFRSAMDANENVSFFEALPNLTASAPSFTTSVPLTAPVVRSDVSLTYPLFEPSTRRFTTRITLEKEEVKDILYSGAKVSVTQVSLCTILVSYDQFEHACYFPFPIAEHSIQVKVSRKSGWIEVSAAVLPLQIVSAARQNPLLLTWDSNHGVSPWNASYVNFNQLPRIAIGSNSDMFSYWLQPHLKGVVSDVEVTEFDKNSVGQNYWFKKSVLTVIEYIAEQLTANDPVVLMLTPGDDPQIYGGVLIFIFTGLYLDGNMQSVVVKGYVIEVSQKILGDTQFLSATDRWIFPGKSPNIGPEVFMLWKRALPIWAERCRDYPHVPACRFAKGVPRFLNFSDAHVCGCGVGKVGGDLKDSLYIDAAPFATPVAISPPFCAGYIETIQRGALDYDTVATRNKFQPESRSLRPRPCTVPSSSFPANEEITVKLCKVCGNDTVKKCAGCGEAYYCSRKCQLNDWKGHKPDCNKAERMKETDKSKDTNDK